MLDSSSSLFTPHLKLVQDAILVSDRWPLFRVISEIFIKCCKKTVLDVKDKNLDYEVKMK